MSTTDTTIDPREAVTEVGAVARGRVIRPGDDDYDAARTVQNGAVDRHPALIVKVADADDVARVVTIARDGGLELAIRCGGHSAAGHGTTDDGVVIDLSELKSIDIDVDGRTVWAGAGLTAGELTSAVGVHGLAIGFGDTGSVGIGGITLGGGVGYLVRKFGLTIDSLLAAEIVTADGQIRLSTPSTTRTCSGRSAAAAATSAWSPGSGIRSTRSGRSSAGCSSCPRRVDTVAGFIAAAEAAPDELSTIANVMPCPPMPFVAPEHHGELVIMAIVAYTGDVEAGERAVAPLRALATPLADLVRPMAYPEIYPPEDPDYRPTAANRTMFLDRVDREVATDIIERLTASTASFSVAQLRVLGGAMARVPADATAFAHRASRIMVNLAAFFDGPDDRTVREAWVKAFAEDLEQDDHGAYVNFVGDEGQERVRAAYPGATWDRLQAVKRRYDPTNLFHLNQNVPPAEATEA